MATDTLQMKIEEESAMKLYMIKTEESSKIRNITFSNYPEEKELALDKTIDALEDLGGMNLECLPVKYLCGLINFLILICKDNKNQLKNDISMISQLDKESRRIADIFDLLEATRRPDHTLQDNIINLKKSKKN